eukprot:Hpha_TRINITY_DN26055_c0_g1::TRINITY_DN26055_c0_g1_i1::g.115225::m.115225
MSVFDSWGKVAAAGTVVAAGATYTWIKGREGTEPDYAKDSTWFAAERDGSKRADLFYAHPTTSVGPLRWNTAWEDMPDKKCTGLVAGDPDLLTGQGDAWREEANLYAPKYRQMGFMSQLQDLEHGDDKLLGDVKRSIDVAAGDLERAFRHFLETRPDKKRPFIVAGHSQGAILMTRVLARCVQGTEHEERFVAAYLAGSYVPKDLFGTVYTSIRACAGPKDTGCIIAYDTRTPEFKPASLNKIMGSWGIWPHHMYWLIHDRYCARPTGTDPGKPRLQINPQTWTAEGGGVHLGTRTACPPAEWAAKTAVTDYAVVVADPEQWYKGAGHAGGPGNLHPLEVTFWYKNIRENVKERLAAWFERARR